MSDLTRKEMSDIALAAAKEAVRQSEERMFAMLGYNVADLNDMKQLREDLEFAHTLRVGSKAAGARAALTLISIISSAIIIAAWEWLKPFLKPILNAIFGHL